MSKTAIIIESRNHQALDFVVKNICDNLDSSWKIIIFCGEYNESFCQNIAKAINADRISVKNIDLPTRLNDNSYSKILCDKKLYDYIPTNTFLVFQTDTMINNSCNHYIDRFLDYDYIGAPWQEFQEVGNGGFSLRKKDKCLEILDKIPYKHGVYEDRYFSLTFDKPYSKKECLKYKEQISLNKPTLDQAKHFSVETIFCEDFFAVHKPWWWQKKNKLKILKEKCVGLDKLIALQK